ncbi:MAG: hypothetical protein ABUK01_01100 [Leptospirales bacterium]
MKKLIVILSLFSLFYCQKPQRSLAMFSLDYTECYDRNTLPYTFVVDTHNHFQPFGGLALPFETMLGFLKKLDIYFVNVYGIGQKLPAISACAYYLDCLGTAVTPSMTNDFVNASNIANRLPDQLPEDIHITLSMSFTDLAEPHLIYPRIKLLDKEFPGLFTWMGEINMVKQALFKNGHTATDKKNIKQWKKFMDEMRKRDIPVSFHSDLGHNGNPVKYKYLMKTILETYPDNKIVWHHMGLSKELDKMDSAEHIAIMKEFLDEYPLLYLDISWRVLYDSYFKEKKSRALYVAFFNEYSARILPGTDFVAGENKTFQIYKEEVEVNSDILKDVDNKAFQNIALGDNYFKLLELPYKAPRICE